MARIKSRDEYSYSPQEVSLVVAARMLVSAQNSLAGSGLPILASLLATKLDPQHVAIFDSGAIGPVSGQSPISVSDSEADFGYLGSSSIVLGGGLGTRKISACILGAAQVDSRGYINSSWIKTKKQWRRLPGAGGAPAMVTFAKTVIILTPHKSNRFPRKCDYISSDPRAKPHFGLKKRYFFVVTEKCVLTWSFEEQVFIVTGLMPGCSISDVKEAIEFAEIRNSPTEIQPPRSGELTALRELVGSGATRWNVVGRTTSKLANS